MSDLTASQWREIRDASAYLPQDGAREVGRYIGVGVLETILKKPRRTTEQNALLWALYDDAMKQAGETLGGWTREDVHEFMLGEYHGWDQFKALGRTRLKPKKRSSRLNKQQFSDFVEFVVRTFAEHGIVLELPGERA